MGQFIKFEQEKLTLVKNVHFDRQFKKCLKEKTMFDVFINILVADITVFIRL